VAIGRSQLRRLRHLVGGEATLAPGLLRHRVLVYGSDEEYVATIVPFLRDALGDDAPRVEFRDSSRWYTDGAAASNALPAFARNLTLASSPATVLCPYDMRRLPDGVVTAAQSTHPEVVVAGEASRNPEYREPTEFLLNLT